MQNEGERRVHSRVWTRTLNMIYHTICKRMQKWARWYYGRNEKQEQDRMNEWTPQYKNAEKMFGAPLLLCFGSLSQNMTETFGKLSISNAFATLIWRMMECELMNSGTYLKVLRAFLRHCFLSFFFHFHLDTVWWRHTHIRISTRTNSQLTFIFIHAYTTHI